jgi:ribosome biogenesis GTPase
MLVKPTKMDTIMKVVSFFMLKSRRQMIDNITTVRVSAVHKERYELLNEETSEVFHGKLKKSAYITGTELYPTTGDYVEIIYNPDGDSTIIATLPRKSYFSRRDPDPRLHRDQSVAANFDYIFIMQSLNQDFNLRRLERYLTMSWQSGATPVIILTKLDLVDDYSPQLKALESIAMGVDIVVLSAKTGKGIDELEKYLKPDKTCVFLGSSGVGKSSLLNALMNEDVMLVKEIRDDDAKGRHTTTHRQLVKLPNGAYVIDTPGMRELGMWDASEGLSDVFADIEALLGNCKFSDCKHQTEPGCVIKAAIENGEITQERFNNYEKLLREIKHSEDKIATMREKLAMGKDLTIWWRNRDKEIW